MDNVIKYMHNIESSMKVKSICIWAVCGVAVLVSCFVVARSYRFSEEQARQIYILDEGKSFVGFRSTGQATITQEVMDHVRTFHMLFFNLAPNRESIESNKEMALNLADKSAANYWDDLQENDGFFNRIIAVNASQQMIIDSIEVDTKVYPYKVETFARVYLVRSSVIVLSRFHSTCQVIKTDRSEKNPHGLIIENFFVEEFNEESRQSR